ELFATEPVRERPGRNLQDAPHGGVDSLDDADARDAEPIAGEEQRIEAPGHAVVEIVDEPGLARREETYVAECRDIEDGGQGRADGRCRLRTRRGLEMGIRPRLSHEHEGDDEAEEGDHYAQVERP